MATTGGWGNTIRAGRKRNGWTQADLGDRVAASISTVSEWEREETPPAIADIDPICRALGLSPEDLLIKLGVGLTPLPEVRLPRDLVRILAAMSTEQQLALVALFDPPANPPRK